METLVELYVNEQFDNLLAPLVFKPKRVVYLCAGFMPDRATRDEVSRSVGSASEGCKVRFIDVGNRSLSSLFRKVGEVVREYPDSVIDMTGGPTGLLVAAHRYCVRNKFRSFFFDEKRGRFVNICGCSAELSNVVIPKLTVPQLISLGGGLVTGTGHSVAKFQENEQVARSIVGIYSNNLSSWNQFSEYLQFACKHYYDPKTKLFMAPMTLLNGQALLLANKKLLDQLLECGALKDLSSDGENVTFRFRSAFVKDLLTTVGMCLELTVYLAALDGGAFDDVDMSVIFDWDGVIHGNFNDTVNEIDVIMTRGLSASFVSCKTARPDPRDLYEIGYLASRFGGRNAGVVLATAFDLSKEAWSVYMRARDMGVTVIERRDIMAGPERIEKLLREPEWLTERP